MTTALKSLVLAAAVLSASSAMATQVNDTLTSKCGETVKCVNSSDLAQANASANANVNQGAMGGSDTAVGYVSGGNNVTNVNNSIAVYQPGVVNLTECLVKGKFNQVCVANKLKQIEADLKPFSKCDPQKGQAATAKCGFSFKQ